MKIKKFLGFSLLEMMLVLAVISSIMVLIANYTQARLSQFKRDKTVLQTQQILNAAMAYYVSNGKWPITGAAGLGTCPSATAGGEQLTTLQTLETSSFLPSVIINNPWQKPYLLNCSTSGGVNYFTVTTDAVNVADAQILAGQLPLASISGTTLVTAQVTVPGQNLNNARSVNFANLYHHGACIPVPTCPTGMSPQVLVVPASVTGFDDASTSLAAYPITSFTAYVTGTETGAIKPNDCKTDSIATDCESTYGVVIAPSTALYWRACLAIYTSQGNQVGSNGPNDWGKWVSVMAITRCSPSGENAGSNFTVWSPHP